jgi:hypothetical protein
MHVVARKSIAIFGSKKAMDAEACTLHPNDRKIQSITSTVFFYISMEEDHSVGFL